MEFENITMQVTLISKRNNCLEIKFKTVITYPINKFKQLTLLPLINSTYD
ncbi:hypothetical protein FOLKNPGA_01107 [Legionella sp. PC1000]|nr:hypothetical protein FOLKNPGA_01107 [Legionella sp. PC1000]